MSENTFPTYVLLNSIKNKITKKAYEQLGQMPLSSAQLNTLAITADKIRSPRIAFALHLVIGLGIGHFFARLYVRGVLYSVASLLTIIYYELPIHGYTLLGKYPDIHIPVPLILVGIWFWIELFLISYSTRKKNSKLLFKAIGLKY